MPTVDYLPVATGGGANVDSQANFNGSGYQTTGFVAGVAQSAQMNKVWRQSSMMTAAWANAISQILNTNVQDDGNLTNLINLILQALFQSASTGINVPIAGGAPVFDGSKGNLFFLSMTQNVTAPTFINLSPLKKYTFILQEDATGGRTFTNPGNLPFDAIDTTANATNIQEFATDASSVVKKVTALAVT